MAVLALNVDQPYASLLAHGIKGWETRPHPPAGWPGIPEGTRRMPGCRITPDDDVLIVSSRKRVTSERVPEGWFCDDETGAIGGGGFGSPFGAWRSYPAPLGAVLGVGRVLDVLPIVDDYDDVCHDDVYHACGGPAAIEHQDGELWLWPEWDSALDDEPADISDQLPYGDWSPGRWAWRMEVRRLDPPVREYDCPECERWCEVLVSNAVGHDRIDLPKHSPLGGDGRPCPGVLPVRGRQGVWRPDPALVAVVREVLDGD